MRWRNKMENGSNREKEQRKEKYKGEGK